MSQPRLLIEDWSPARPIGVACLCLHPGREMPPSVSES